MPRLRQAVLAASDLDATVAVLQERAGLGEPYNDPAVDHFGLSNAVFAIGDTFLEVVSPVREGTSAGRHLQRLGGDGGYMLMVQVEDLDAARARAAATGVREVFEVSGVDDIAEVHLHPGDMRGAIVSLSRPEPATSWRWGGEGWEQRATPGRVAGATVSVPDPVSTEERWSEVLGCSPAEAGIEFSRDPGERGVTEVRIAEAGARETIAIGSASLRFVAA